MGLRSRLTSGIRSLPRMPRLSQKSRKGSIRSSEHNRQMSQLRTERPFAWLHPISAIGQRAVEQPLRYGRASYQSSTMSAQPAGIS